MMQNSKLIGLVVTNFAGSGAEKVVLNLFNMFEKYGHNVYIFLLEDIICYDLSDKEKKKTISLTTNRKYHKLFSFIGDKRLHHLLDKKMLFIEKEENQNFDLILSNLPASDRVLQYSTRSNVYFCIHTSYFQEIEEFKSKGKYSRAKKKYQLYRQIYKNKKLIIVSNKIEEDLNKLEIEYKSIICIYNPFNFEEIIKKANENIDMIEEDYILSASAFRPVKRYDILLDAYKKSQIKLKLILLCNPTKEIIEMINNRELENKVIILGFKRNPYPYIKNAKALILSSEREGLPTVLIESLILGTPVVSTNCISGPSEILIGELSKYLAKVNDSDDLALKMNQVIKNTINIKAEYISKFNEDNIITQYLSLINK
jgi:glycosyltransferase involved in cell wall biosynthesis